MNSFYNFSHLALFGGELLEIKGANKNMNDETLCCFCEWIDTNLLQRQNYRCVFAKIDLSNNKLTDNSIPKLLQLFQNHKLQTTSFNLERNNFSDETAKYFSLFIKDPNIGVLHEINLSHNFLTESGSTTLLHTINEHPSYPRIDVINKREVPTCISLYNNCFASLDQFLQNLKKKKLQICIADKFKKNISYNYPKSYKKFKIILYILQDKKSYSRVNKLKNSFFHVPPPPPATPIKDYSECHQKFSKTDKNNYFCKEIIKLNETRKNINNEDDSHKKNFKIMRNKRLPIDMFKNQFFPFKNFNDRLDISSKTFNNKKIDKKKIHLSHVECNDFKNEEAKYKNIKVSNIKNKTNEYKTKRKVNYFYTDNAINFRTITKKCNNHCNMDLLEMQNFQSKYDLGSLSVWKTRMRDGYSYNKLNFSYNNCKSIEDYNNSKFSQENLNSYRTLQNTNNDEKIPLSSSQKFYPVTSPLISSVCQVERQNCCLIDSNKFISAHGQFPCLSEDKKSIDEINASYRIPKLISLNKDINEVETAVQFSPTSLFYTNTFSNVKTVTSPSFSFILSRFENNSTNVPSSLPSVELSPLSTSIPVSFTELSISEETMLCDSLKNNNNLNVNETIPQFSNNKSDIFCTHSFSADINKNNKKITNNMSKINIIHHDNDKFIHNERYPAQIYSSSLINTSSLQPIFISHLNYYNIKKFNELFPPLHSVSCTSFSQCSSLCDCMKCQSRYNYNFLDTNNEKNENISLILEHTIKKEQENKDEKTQKSFFMHNFFKNTTNNDDKLFTKDLEKSKNNNFLAYNKDIFHPVTSNFELCVDNSNPKNSMLKDDQDHCNYESRMVRSSNLISFDATSSDIHDIASSPFFSSCSLNIYSCKDNESDKMSYNKNQIASSTITTQKDQGINEELSYCDNLNSFMSQDYEINENNYTIMHVNIMKNLIYDPLDDSYNLLMKEIDKILMESSDTIEQTSPSTSLNDSSYSNFYLSCTSKENRSAAIEDVDSNIFYNFAINHSNRYGISC